MKFISKDRAETVGQGSVMATEYEFGDADINVAHITLSGRYPDSGWAVNTVSKECCYITRGSGTLTVEDSVFELEEGDACIIEAGERYFWEADMTLVIASTPPWTKEQARQEA